MEIFGTPFQANTMGAFDCVINEKKGVNNVSYKKRK